MARFLVLLTTLCLPGRVLLAIENPSREIPIGFLAAVDGPGAELDMLIRNSLENYFSNLPFQYPRFRLRVIPSEKQWGRQTGEIVRSVFEDGTKVIVSGTDVRSAHLAAQIVSRSKGDALLVALASDPTLTQSGVPWVFQLNARADGALDHPEELAVLVGGALVRALQQEAEDVNRICDFLAAEAAFRRAAPTRPD